jgi:hypothetical protein
MLYSVNLNNFKNHVYSYISFDPKNIFAKYCENIQNSCNYLKSHLLQTYTLEKNLNEITKLLANNNDPALNKLVNIYLSIPQNKYSYYHSKILFKNFLNNLNNKNLDIFLNKLIIKNLNSNEKNLLNNVLDFLTFDKLTKLISFKNSHKIVDLKFIKEKAIELANIVPQLNTSSNISRLNKTLSDNSASISIKINNFFYSFWSTFMKANDFTIDEPTPSSRWEAQYRLKTFYELFYYPFFALKYLTTSLSKLSPIWWIPYAGSFTIVFSLISTIKIFDYWFSSKVIRLTNNYDNLSEKAKLNKLDSVIARQSATKKIVNLLGYKNYKPSKTALLIGKTGVGKSALIHSLAKDINDGKYPHLKDKQIFEINTAALHDQGNYDYGTYNSRLDMLLNDIKGKEDRVILFLDEIHTIVKDPKDPDSFDLANRLKTILSNEKINIIGATTTQEYENHIKKFDALDRRFEKIELKELSKKDNILAIQTLAFNKFKNIKITKEAISHALDIAKLDDKVSTLATAINIIETCYNHIILFNTPQMDEQSALIDKLKKIKNEYCISSDQSIFDEENNKKLKKIKELDEKINLLNIQINDKKKKFQELQSLNLKTNLYKQEYFNFAHALKALPIKDKNYISIAKVFLFLSDYFPKVSNAEISKKETDLKSENVNTVIDKELIDKLFPK